MFLLCFGGTCVVDTIFLVAFKLFVYLICICVLCMLTGHLFGFLGCCCLFALCLVCCV